MWVSKGTPDTKLESGMAVCNEQANGQTKKPRGNPRAISARDAVVTRVSNSRRQEWPPTFLRCRSRRCRIRTRGCIWIDCKVPRALMTSGSGSCQLGGSGWLPFNNPFVGAVARPIADNTGLKRKRPPAWRPRIVADLNKAGALIRCLTKICSSRRPEPWPR